MGLLITNRILTKVGTVFLRNARELAKQAYQAGLANKYQIINGFLLRASGRSIKSDGEKPVTEKGAYIASVMDTPGYILFAGPLETDNVGNTFGLSPAVGIRDDFLGPGTQATFSCIDNESFGLLLAPERMRPSGKAVEANWLPAIQQSSWMMGYSRMSVPIIKTPEGGLDVSYLDDEEIFDYSCNVCLTGSITSFFTGSTTAKLIDGSIVIGGFKANYFLKNQLSIDETDLPGNWKLVIRRLLPLAEDFNGDNPHQRRAPKNVMITGFAMRPASYSMELDGVDHYCHAARTFRQFQGLWGSPFQDFDRNGEQGLLVATGSQNRSQYDAESGKSVFADIDRLVVLRPQDIQQSYLHPDPEMLPGDPLIGRPSFPNFGSFLVPHVVPVNNGFVVFSVYTTFLQRPSDVRGDAWSLITVLPNLDAISLRADWDTKMETIQTGVDGEFMYPWIVGATSVSDGDTATAYCVVWEQTYERGTTIRTKGEWAIYSTSGDRPARKTISGYAPLFSIFQDVGYSRFESPDFDLLNPLSSIYYAGDNKIVTSCISYPASESSRSVRCAVFDVVAGTINVRGEIAVSNSIYDKCFITVVQKYKPEEGSKPYVEAVLIATITSHFVGSAGRDGKVYISVDGGDNWRPYITDAGAQGGAFYVGNKLWKYDVDADLDGRSKP
ncbi:hypothetical protein ACTACK_10595 [Pseudomonas syringae]|uniref:hypothetical protein n=1 Tax=Pseudomonas syringae TaxID=317 RepID=UPI003F753705